MYLVKAAEMTFVQKFVRLMLMKLTPSCCLGVRSDVLSSQVKGQSAEVNCSNKNCKKNAE